MSFTFSSTYTSNSVYGCKTNQDLWLEEISYKPGWSFELRGQTFYFLNGDMNVGNTVSPPWYLLVTAHTLDSSRSDETLWTFTHMFALNPHAIQERESFHREVLRCVVAVETHEAMEFLKAGGERIRDPHPYPGTIVYQ